MDIFEQDAMLQSMQILVDTREQNTETCPMGLKSQIIKDVTK